MWQTLRGDWNSRWSCVISKKNSCGTWFCLFAVVSMPRTLKSTKPCEANCHDKDRMIIFLIDTCATKIWRNLESHAYCTLVLECGLTGLVLHWFDLIFNIAQDCRLGAWSSWTGCASDLDNKCAVNLLKSLAGLKIENCFWQLDFLCLIEKSCSFFRVPKDLLLGGTGPGWCWSREPSRERLWFLHEAKKAHESVAQSLQRCS